MKGYGQTRWLTARATALQRARHRCHMCGSKHSLRVHHIDGRGMTGPRATDLTNLRVLCESCHRKAHVRMMSDRDRTHVVIPQYRRE